MVRILLPLLLTVLHCTGVRAQDTLKVSSEIKEATVFLEGAQVTRRTTTDIPSGRRTLVFTGLTTDLDPLSVQVNSTGDDFTVLSVSHRLNFGTVPQANSATRKLSEEITALDKQKNILQTAYQIAKDEELLLAANREVAGDENGLDAAQLAATVTFHRERLTAIRTLYLEITDELETIDEKQDALRRQVVEAGEKSKVKTTAEVIVVTEADRATQSDFTLTYLVPNASWTPHYDVRVTDISRPVDLRYRAKVMQSSGEDWTDVRLTLSTGDPQASALAPTLSTWRLTNGSRPPTYRPNTVAATNFGYQTVAGYVTERGGMPLIGASVLVRRKTIGTVTDIDGHYQLDLPDEATELTVSYTGYETTTVQIASPRLDVVLSESARQLEEVVVTGYAGAARGRSSKRNQRRNEKNQSDELAGRASGVQVAPPAAASAPVPVATVRKATTVNFDIELPYTIPSDGEARDVDIQRYELPATYTHFSVPKYEEAAFLTASVTNWEQYDFLTGQVNLFFEGTYLGVSQLDVDNTSDTLNLSLGRDPNVIINREETDDYRARNFFGSKMSESRGYTISVRNKKQQAITLVIKDQVPVSGDEQVDVTPEVSSQAALDDKTGFVTWRVNVASNVEWRDEFGYVVKHPRSMRLQLE
ncbi:DUF4139 domain-containing protein [Neolewinella antarctica]|uniref:Mucoidy inhibitor MuiA family protein n=1 Tax=Neolewinella antarctica TaxID=442734 RepID=A0ABX0XBZ2_9BACT|nr:DUF4139 domain-containing protein [Neolewinella antarctica]NJC26444.1 hypothetical protein [Neolewinella antarctica]